MSNQQKSVDAGHLFFEAERQKSFITGSEAVAEAIKRANVDMAIAYPITPQSESMHLIGDLYARGYLKDYYRAENEFAVMASIHGAALGGGRVFTATSGPGTLRAMEMFPVWAGSRQPIVCAFMCRGVALPPSIQPENIEMSFLLDTGMLMFHAENAQDYFDMILKGYAIAEQPDVHLPVGVFADGFFVTHTREIVMLPPEELKLQEYDPKACPVPVFDMESPPARITRDPLLNKSNFISYAANASWHQEILAAAERARKHIKHYLGGLIETENKDAEILIVASGTAVSQSREAIKALREEGIDAGLVKVKSIRPFPEAEIREVTKDASLILVPEFNAGGWLAREVKASIDNNSRVVAGPRVFGGMTMPKDLIVSELKSALQSRSHVNASPQMSK
ncbi:transketolase C-terminal domain-containing protein [Chitinispirillales bacterium ANBcel5]|uniref:transketolase C-terminal domain-containing protein n=1 Tax=Cellulosispirillum alkaliphilum TaxID=3039283 RepID=UPI002A543CEC|nr:transketolase C-terminal domain-containing protein [Chitinispirillales bacterium ANBcel5]